MPEPSIILAIDAPGIPQPDRVEVLVKGTDSIPTALGILTAWAMAVLDTVTDPDAAEPNRSQFTGPGVTPARIRLTYPKRK